DIANALFISRSHLSTRFKQETGMNLTEYIHYIKISEAKHLLKHTDKNLLLISNYLGYSSQSHFTRIFKKMVGMSPIEYREK
ncbi:MAG: helix-turn-helix transcriptional regulator, partial [Agathobacter sp.]|nr:helix-turn-helix transcriptional regulator [Agathobacter sp.]